MITRELKNKWDLFIGHFDILVRAILVLGQWQQPFSPSFSWIISSPWVGEGLHHCRCHPGNVYSCFLSFGFSADSVDSSAVGSIAS